MLQENTKNRMDKESKEHRFIWSNTVTGQNGRPIGQNGTDKMVRTKW